VAVVNDVVILLLKGSDSSLVVDVDMLARWSGLARHFQVKKFRELFRSSRGVEVKKVLHGLLLSNWKRNLIDNPGLHTRKWKLLQHV
jgi:hypothetical protein